MRGLLITILVLAWAVGVGAFVYILSSLPNNPAASKGGPPPWGLFVCFFGVIIATVIITVQLDRLRRRELAAGLESRGYILNTADKSPAEVLHYRPHKRHHSYKQYFSAVGLHNDRPAHIAEYSYAIGHGKGRHEFRVIEVALDFAAPASIAIIPRAGFFNRDITKLFQPAPAPPINDPAFNKRWDVDTSEPAAATEFLTPYRVAALKAAPRMERQWVAADGWLTCSWHKRPRIGDIDAMLARIEQVVEG